MKGTERRHLKDNELAVLAGNARLLVEERKRQIIAVAVAIAVVGGVALAYYLWNQHVQGQAHSLLADAMTVADAPVGPAANPDAPESGPRYATEHARSQAALTKFKIVADAYPTTDAGLFARYREATTWMALDAPAEAATAFQEVINRGKDTIYGQMAQLGLAESQVRTGQFDQAIATYKQMAERKDGQLPADGLLMQLGRTYLDAGKKTDAQQTFDRLLKEYPESAFGVEARQQLDSLKKS